jgi:hypothetical protein
MSLGTEELDSETEASKLLSAVQLRVESQVVKRRLHVCCCTVIFGVCDLVRLS